MSALLDELSLGNQTKIGIIGGGQIGKMIAQEAKRMSIKVIVLDPSEDCPASTICDQIIVGDFKNEDKIRELAKYSDVITYEIELANSKALKNLEEENYPIFPSPHSLYTIQNKFRQKIFLKENNLPVPRFKKLDSFNDFLMVAKEFGFPFMVKACEDSYDGRGNYLIKSNDDIFNAYDSFNNREIFAEQFVDFKKEISIMVARNKKGQIESFPLVDNIHQNNILDTTIAPTNVSSKIKQASEIIAKKVVTCLNDIGIFGIEMFVAKNDEGFINEIAPRPHNSGHYSIEGCSISQFEQHIRAILNFPLSKPELLRPSVMKNILGPPNFSGNYIIKGLSTLLSIPSTKLHIYGKQESRPGRKLGHITCTGPTLDVAMKRCSDAKNSIEIRVDK